MLCSIRTFQLFRIDSISSDDFFRISYFTHISWSVRFHQNVSNYTRTINNCYILIVSNCISFIQRHTIVVNSHRSYTDESSRHIRLICIKIAGKFYSLLFGGHSNRNSYFVAESTILQSIALTFLKGKSPPLWPKSQRTLKCKQLWQRSVPSPFCHVTISRASLLLKLRIVMKATYRECYC